MNTTQTAIAQAVEPLRAAACDRARQYAHELIGRTITEYQTNPEAFSYPVGLYGSAYALQKAKHVRLQALTHCPESPKVRVRSEAKCEAFVEQAVQLADAQYTAFIRKLEHKVGEHVSATLEGNHVWGESFLTVQKPDGRHEVWKTQTILNVSVLGKLFNQFPTRKVKR